MQSIEQAKLHIQALTGSPDSIVNIRAFDDNKARELPPVIRRGSINDLWLEMCALNAQGYGIFIGVNHSESVQQRKEDISLVRAAILDLDSPTATQDAERAFNWSPRPSWYVQTSANKFHFYWPLSGVTPLTALETVQKKLAVFFNGDGNSIDVSRVLRLAGFMHMKNPAAPYAVQINTISWNPVSIETLAEPLQGVLIDHITTSGTRSDLGDPEKQAPSWEWLEYAMRKLDPNNLSYAEWLRLSAAYKQAGWGLKPEHELREWWDDWCSQYHSDNPAENAKKWESLDKTQLGWTTFKYVTDVGAQIAFGHHLPPAVQPVTPSLTGEIIPFATNPLKTPQFSSEILNNVEMGQYFKDCFYVANAGQIYTPQGLFMNQTQFSAQYGGRVFIKTTTGKVTDNAWDACLKNTTFSIPKVHHTRFLPDKPWGATIEDEMGNIGVNTYIPARVKVVSGDVTPFLKHLEIVLPHKGDRKILMDFIAHAVKFPGFKIPWMPVIQGVQGAGKSLIGAVISRAVGRTYTYTPRTEELNGSGARFNDWMRNRLIIILEEVKSDDKWEMMERLKTWISQSTIEMEGKQIAKFNYDNVANFIGFTNHKNALYITLKERRYAMMYSALQSREDLLHHDMHEDGKYFHNLWNWLENGGYEAMTYYLLHYPIAKGAVPMRAPITSTWKEVIECSRSPLEQAILDAIEDGRQGFRGGFVSVPMVSSLRQAARIGEPVIIRTLDEMGYVKIGRAGPFFAESSEEKSLIYGLNPSLDLRSYSLTQGYQPN